MVLVPKTEYEALKKRLPPAFSHMEPLPPQDTTILESRLPDELKIKLFQEAKRVMVNQANEMKNTPLLIKNVNDKPQREFPPESTPSGAEQGIPSYAASPMEEENVHDASAAAAYDDDDLESFPGLPDQDDLEVAKYLKAHEIRPDSRGDVVIEGKTLEGNKFLNVVDQLTDGRRKRSPGTNAVMHYLKNLSLPPAIFSPAIIRAVRNSTTPSIDIAPRKRSDSIKIDEASRKRTNTKQGRAEEKRKARFQDARARQRGRMDERCQRFESGKRKCPEGESESSNMRAVQTDPSNIPKAKSMYAFNLERKRKTPATQVEYPAAKRQKWEQQFDVQGKRKRGQTLRDTESDKRMRGALDFGYEKKRKFMNLDEDAPSKRMRGEFKFDLEHKRKYVDPSQDKPSKRKKGDLSFDVEKKRKHAGNSYANSKKKRGDLKFGVEGKRKRGETSRDSAANKKKRGEMRFFSAGKRKLDATAKFPQAMKKIRWESY